MPVIFMYLIKLSLSLAVVYAFYQLVLRRLTFYTWNRWYLAGYTAICFFIPFIDISLVLERNDLGSSQVVSWVPMVENGRALINAEQNSNTLPGWEIGMLIIVAGMLVLLLKLLIQFLALRKMKSKAVPVEHNGLHIYQVDDHIMPFSFGNSIFINRSLHNDAELQEIIKHEFIHVKQKHSLDIIWSELFCIINWYNPFAWLIKKAIRQNLEFIADNKVVESGIPKKEYQYLLLKVIGNNQYSIATAFNYSSLKKRIAMMNKLKSTRKQLLRMLFLLPATAILLLAFRNGIIETPGSEDIFSAPQVTSDVNHEAVNPVPGQAAEDQNFEMLLADTMPKQKPSGLDLASYENVESISLDDDIVSVKLKNGETVAYNLALTTQKEAFEKKYGKVVYAVVPVKVKTESGEYIAVTGQPTKTIEGDKVTFTAGTLKKTPLTEAVTVTGQPLTKITLAQPITVDGEPLSEIRLDKPVIVQGKTIDLVVSTVTPVTANGAKLSPTVSVKPSLALTTPVEFTTPVVEAGLSPVTTKLRSDKIEFLKLGGLTTVNEGQYILLDGKELPASYNGSVKGTFRITFVDKNEAVKKYGNKGTNGAILLETIKKDNSAL